MRLRIAAVALLLLFAFDALFHARKGDARAQVVNLPSSKALLPGIPGSPQSTNSFPTAVALSPDGRYLAILNNGYGTAEANYHQSIAILDLQTNKVDDFADERLGLRAHQTYFLGLGFSRDGKRLYASISSLTDPEGKGRGDTGNGIAVYGFDQGQLTPESFIKIPLASVAAGKTTLTASKDLPKETAIPYPAGLAVVERNGSEQLLIAENLADDVILLDTRSGQVTQRFDLSTATVVPATYPYGVVASRDGKTGFCSLWNASEVVQLDLESGQTLRRIPLLAPRTSSEAGSHPTAMLLSPDEKDLYVTLTNSDRVAVIGARSGSLAGFLSTELPEQKYGGSFPEAFAQTPDGKRLFVADASADAVAVFDVKQFGGSSPGVNSVEKPDGFIPTEWYPTALAVKGDDLFIVTGKGKGTGPNTTVLTSSQHTRSSEHPYIASLLHGSVARVSIRKVQARLAQLTGEVERSNLMQEGATAPALFNGRRSPIRHVIYIIRENRTYDQVFGDLRPGNGDASLCMYGEGITPNAHKLAKQFGIIDNFYCSSEVSGDGHVWSMAGITSDYTEKTWEIGYRGRERTYDFEGEMFNHNPLTEDIPDVDDPGTGYIWANVARHGLTHRNDGEFVTTHWCDRGADEALPEAGTPLPSQGACRQRFVQKGGLLPANAGQPPGSASPWPWPIPMIAFDEATKPELAGHFDPKFADFRLDYPDQLRADEFLREFKGFVSARKNGQGNELPQFVILRLPDDHTAGTRPRFPTPSASVADNDLAVGRVVEAVSRSPYWDDTAIFILEDDAQDGADHVDAHRSNVLVISKYSPGSASHPLVDHHFYTTVSVLHTMEALLGLPPMNNNDAQAPLMAPLFSGAGDQQPFTADAKNRENGLIYQTNSARAPGAKQSAQMDFTHADQANTAVLNAILWRDRKGNTPMPKPRHVVFP